MAATLNPIHRALSHLAVGGFGLLSGAIRIMPPALWGWAAGAIAPLLWWFLPRYRLKAMENLIAQGRTPAEARKIGMACFRSNLLVFFESLAMPRLLARRGVHVESRVSPAAQRVIEQLKSGEETIALAVGGHTGVWEFVGAELARLAAPAPCVVSARLVKNPIIRNYLIGLRRSFGIHIVEKDDFLRFLFKNFRNRDPHIYVFLCDQHSKGGARAPFMGRPACTVTVPANLIRKYRMPVFTGRCRRRKAGDYLCEIDLLDTSPSLDLPEKEMVFAITETINTHIEENIAAAHEQWTWGHRRWRPCCGEKEVSRQGAKNAKAAGKK